MAELAARYAKLQELLQQYAASGLAVCFSGGTDSSLLMAAAQQTGISPLLAITLVTPLQSAYEIEQARETARSQSWTLQLLELNMLQLQPVAENWHQRCYHCKKSLYQALWQAARKAGIEHLADGCNADDLTIFRPGNQAAQELQIAHPLAEAGLTKAEVRQLAQQLGLANWDAPAAPCLASRFPYHTALSESALRQVEAAEQCLRQAGFREFRARVHGDLLRLELPANDMDRALRYRETLAEQLQSLGYRYVTLDLLPFASGSFDR